VTFSVGDRVRISYADVVGVVEVADLNGTFFCDDPSYDIYVEEDGSLYKHIPECFLDFDSRDGID